VGFRNQALLERVLGEYEIDTVIHLAAQTIVGVANRNPIATLETNIAGTWALLEACHRSPSVRQIVIASSDKAYGEQSELPYHEAMPLAGRNAYDVSKSCADLIALYANVYDLPVVITRCANFFGGGDLNWNRLIPGTIRSVFRGKRPIIRSNGLYLRDYLYVEDAVTAYLDSAEQLAKRPELRGEAYNFSTGAPASVFDVVRCILAHMESGLEPDIRNEATHEIRCQFASAVKARDVLGWRPMFSLDQGLERTIAWYRNYLTSAVP
jgi:CDP-glucose 4,6-dehydratase